MEDTGEEGMDVGAGKSAEQALALTNEVRGGRGKERTMAVIRWVYSLLCQEQERGQGWKYDLAPRAKKRSVRYEQGKACLDRPNMVH